MHRAKTADDYYADAPHWRDEIAKLREILHASGLEETIKWGQPTYTTNGKNVVGLGAFKSYCGLWFFQGALLADEDEVLINAQEGKTKALRQWRMTSCRDINQARIKRYVKEAIALADQGKEIKAARPGKVVVPAELKKALAADKSVSAAFDQLRPGQQREYAQHITEAKRAETKERRIEKILPMIAAGIGLNDRYR